MAKRVSIMDQDLQINLDANYSLLDLDFNWYYGCLFSSSKRAIHGPGNFILSVEDGDKKDQENGAKNSLYKQMEEINLNFEDQRKSDKESGIAECDDSVASIFRVFDEDGDGRVSTDEIMRFMERLNLEIPMEDLESAVKSVSVCGVEFLTFTEFRDFYLTIIFAVKDEIEELASSGVYEIDDMAIYEAFGVFDQNGDGFISAVELGDVLCKLGFTEGRDVCYCQRMIEFVDANGDGFVDLEEFRHLITRSSSPLSSNLLC